MGESRIRKTKIIALIVYLLTVLWFTVFNRSFQFIKAQFELFWSYKAWFAGDANLGLEIMANMVMFVPFGFLLSSLFSKRRFIIPVAMLFSLTIETLQLFLMRGLFEWDDVVSNMIGACIGILLFVLITKITAEKNRRIITTAISAAFILTCLVVYARGHGIVEADSTSRAYCFQVDRVKFADGTIYLNGFTFRYEHLASDYTLLLRSEKGSRVVMEKEIVSRPDVNEYFSCDYSSSGFTARAEVDEGEYEVLIKWPWSIALSTGVFVSPSGVHYVKDDEFTPLEIDAEFVENGVLRVYRPDYHCWVYQYEGSLYWIVDQDFFFEEDGSTYIQYQLWTTQTQNLPARRLENGHLWDNIGGNFEDYELQGEWGEYRVMKREIPTAYSVTSIVTGYYKNGEWIWKEYFRPYYEF